MKNLHIKIKIFLAAAVCISAILLSSCDAADRLIVSGSTSVQPYAEILAEEFYHQHPEIGIDILGGGSAAGIEAVLTGVAEIGMSSRNLKATEEELGLVVFEIAKDGLAVIVHPSNPIANLTKEQIRGIYEGKIKKWSELGDGKGSIHVITREEGSGTRSAFEDLLMAGADITPTAIVQDSNGAVRLLVSDDPNAIGFISLGLVKLEGQKPVKALNLDGIEASRDNVLNGSYGLFRPFLFLTLGEPNEAARLFIDFTLSAEGQRILSAEGLIPE